MLVSRWLGQLAADGLIEAAGDGFALSAPLPDFAFERLRSEAETALEDTPFLFEYVERCGKLLAAVIVGDESPLETLFPGGSGETATYLYRHWSVPRYFNGIAAAIVESVVKANGLDQPIRLLEIGAGTGSTSLSLLPTLPPEQALYFFTDVSDFFLGRAQEALGNYPFVRYGLLDIEQNPTEQGYGAHAFDVVIAANVLHATRDLGRTVEHIRSMLKPGGLLLLVEATRSTRWSDMTVGLIEGWQRFEDGLRTDNPLLSADQWNSLLRSRGFDGVESLPGSDSPADILGSRVIVARVASDEVSGQEIKAELLAESPGMDLAGAAEMAREKAVLERTATLLQQLETAPANEHHDLWIDYVRDRVNAVLRRDPDKPLDRQHRLMDLGIDSLMAVELRNLLGAGLGLAQPLPATLVFDWPTVDAVATYLAEQLLADDEVQVVSKASAVETAAPGSVTEEDLRELSEEDVEELLLKRMRESGSGQ
jgi:SAM-dependent methyltransferase/acyl carrier protein